MTDTLARRCTAALMCGLFTLTTVTPALAQGKPAKPPTGAPQAKPPAGKPAAPATGKPSPSSAAKPTTAAKPVVAKPKPEPRLTDKQKKDEAKKRFKEGETKLASGDYAGALEAYKAADHLVPGAAPKYKIALCYDKMTKVPDAVDAYQAFLDAKPDPDKFKDKISEAQAREDVLKKTPGKLKLTTDPASPPSFDVAVDGKSKMGATAFAIDPGHHTIKVTASGFDPASQEIDVKWAEEKELSMKLNPAPVSAATPPPAVAAGTPAPATSTPATSDTQTGPQPTKKRSNVLAYAALGLGVVGAGVGTVFGVQALGSKSDYNAHPTQDGLDKVKRQSLIADISYGAAIGLGAIGVILLVTNTDAPAKATTTGSAPASKKPTFAPYVTATGAGAAALMQF